MGYVRRFPVIVTTAADGSATAFSPTVSGKVSSVRYVKTDFADGSTFTLTAENTGETIWTESNVNASATRAPRQTTHSTAGVAATFDATHGVVDQIALANDRVKIVIASGGNVKTGTFHITVE